MARIFITGSADGLGQLLAKLLADQGHEVVLHARNANRAIYATGKVPHAISVITGNLSDLEATKRIAQEVNALGSFDTIIHNAGVYQASTEEILNVNVLAPYILTFLIQKPKRLIYLSSGMHQSGRVNFENLKNGRSISYSDSKLYVLMLAKAVARIWPDVYSNAVDPGWVPTKMGGPGAPDDLQKGFETQAWLAASNDTQALVSGHYFFHQKTSRYNYLADDIKLQEQLLDVCKEITGVTFTK